MSSQNKVKATNISVAIDDGYAQTKVLAPNSDPMVFPTHVTPGESNISSIDGEVSSGHYSTEGQTYVVETTSQSEDTRYNGYHGSALNRVAVHHALHQLGLEGQTVNIVVGLPIGEYFTSTGSKDKQGIKAKIDSLKVPVEYVCQGKKATITIDSVQIMSQGLAAYLDYALDDNGVNTVDLDAPIAVIDIGGRTTDIAYLENVQSVVHNKSGSINSGVMSIFDELRPQLAAKHNLKEAELSVGKLQQVVRTNKMRMFGKDIDVKTIVEKSKVNASGMIKREVERKLGSGYSVDKVLLVGGGAIVFPEIADIFKHSLIVEAPEFANVRGMYKYTRLE